MHIQTRSLFWIIWFSLGFIGCSEKEPEMFMNESTQIDLDSIDDIYAPTSVKLIMKKVCDWQVTHPVERNDGNGMAWARSAFYAGIMATYQATGEEKYLNQVLRWGTAKQWKLDNR